LLTVRELNRAVLARQGLLERASLPLDAAVETVGALQAQYAPAPPVALWSRVRGLTLDAYARACEERRLVTGLDAYVDAHTVLPTPPTLDPGHARTALVRHHLRAFGPASRDDIASWMGEPRPANVQPVLDALAPELVRFTDEAGRTLYDPADAPRPGAGVAAPVRFLPAFDSLLLAYAPRFRGRILPEPYRAAVIRTANLQVLPTVLVDGLVAGTWEARAQRRSSAVVVRPFQPLTRQHRQALTNEGEGLARFLRPDATSHAVQFGER
jgi:hypothetical protein